MSDVYTNFGGRGIRRGPRARRKKIIEDELDKMPAVLHAYDAANVARELYNSEHNSGRDRAGVGLRFNVPTVVGGRVYVGAKGELDIYGLISARSLGVFPRLDFDRFGRTRQLAARSCDPAVNDRQEVPAARLYRRCTTTPETEIPRPSRHASASVEQTATASSRRGRNDVVGGGASGNASHRGPDGAGSGRRDRDSSDHRRDRQRTPRRSWSCALLPRRQQTATTPATERIPVPTP